MQWYEWVLAIGAVILALLAYQNFTASISELQARAAWVFLATFGFLALLAALAAWRSIARHNPTTGRKSGAA